MVPQKNQGSLKTIEIEANVLERINNYTLLKHIEKYNKFDF